MEKLTIENQIKLQNILKYYNEYRKTYYDNTIGIEIENKKRQEEQQEIYKKLQKVENIKKTEEYILLNDEKCNINKQIVIYENIIYDIRNTYEEYKHYEDVLDDTEEVKIICEKIELLYDNIEIIENKQLDIINKNGIDTELLKNNNIKIQL
jgi:hypothetical protein